MAKGQNKTLTADEKLEAMEARLGQMDSENKRLNALAMQFMTAPPQTVVETGAPGGDDEQMPVDLNLEGLPDPTQDAEGFRKGLAKRMKKAIRGVAENVRASIPQPVQVDPRATARDQFYGNLWETFKTDHKELAPFEGELRTVTAQEVAKLAQRGIDVDRYIMANPEGFAADVAKAAEKHLTDLGVDLEAKRKSLADGGNTTRQVDGQPGAFIGGPGQDDDDNSASLEIFSSRPSIERQTAAKGNKASNLITELKDMQAASGLFGTKARI